MRTVTKGIVDLHLHTNKSDGTMSPEELVKAASKAGVKLISITDHDTIDGVIEAKMTAKKLGLSFITGIEISSKFKGGVCHILGYGFDIENKYLKTKLKSFQEARRIRNDKIILKLKKLGIDISEKSIRKDTKSTSSLGRPHIAQQLIKLGVVMSVDQAFQEYLGIKGKAFVDKEIFSPQETIEMIHQAGGNAVLAHPSSLKLEPNDFEVYISKLKKMGLGGLEAFSPSNSEAQVTFFKKVAGTNELFLTAGSDFHGLSKPEIQIGNCFGNKSIDITELINFPLMPAS